MIKVGVVGLGHWGPNLVRNFSNLPDSEVVALCDINEDNLRKVGGSYSKAYATSNIDEVLDKNLIDAIVIATPTKTHYSLVKRALEQGLHTFVEKPLSTSAEECEDLIDIAKKNGTVLFVGHIFLYNAAVVKLKEVVGGGDLGNIRYITSTRLNLGPVRQDVSALWDLATHDISIILHLVESAPVSVNCQGSDYLKKNVQDVCSLTIRFENGCMAIIYSSWLHPNKQREMTIVGDKKMIVYNEIDPLEKIKIFDKGVEMLPHSDSPGEMQISYRYGDIYIPRIIEVEPLKTECQHFLQCIKDNTQPKTDGYNGLDVVSVLAAADYSLRNGGGEVTLNP